VRLRETDGRPATARLRLAAGIEAAWRGDLLEERPGGDEELLEVSEGTVRVPLRPFETATLRVRLAAAAAEADVADLVPAGPPEPAQPVFTRYWLHGKGPAPAGNVPVAVHFSPTRVTLPGPAAPGGSAGSAGHEARVTLTVACGPSGDRGQVELVVPDGLTVRVDGAADARAPLGYDLAPNGFAAWDVTVSAPAGTPAGRYFLTARITDRLGQVLEDAVLVTLGEAGPPEPDLEPEELFVRLQSDVMALAGEADLELTTTAVRLAPGASGPLEVKVTSHLASELRGEVQLVSPVGTWPGTGPWTQPVTVSPGGEATVRFAVTAPATAVPGWESWLLVKLMYFGRVRYSDSVPLTVI